MTLEHLAASYVPGRRASLSPRTMLATARAASTRASLLAAATRMTLFAYSSLVHTTLKLLRCVGGSGLDSWCVSPALCK